MYEDGPPWGNGKGTMYFSFKYFLFFYFNQQRSGKMKKYSSNNIPIVQPHANDNADVLVHRTNPVAQQMRGDATDVQFNLTIRCKKNRIKRVKE